MDKQKSAAILVIGDEILSGRTVEKNINYLATRLTDLGVDLCEARIVSDSEPAIIKALNSLRADYDYVFTSGGIGPTHDDITAQSVARAFGVSIGIDERAVALIENRWGKSYLNKPRLRMAMIPKGADLIVNEISAAPGFTLENVFVFAGVPQIMQAMFEKTVPLLTQGMPMLSQTIDTDGLPESAYADQLAELAGLNPDVSLGSYPSMKENRRFNNVIVARSRNKDRLDQVTEGVRRMLSIIIAARNPS